MLERVSSVERGSARLAERRRTRRRRLVIAFCVLFCIALGTFIWGLWQSPMRISNVTIYGADVSFTDYATRLMQGSYLGIIPRDSTFFFPASSIRATILAAHTDIAAVSIFRKGFTGISLKMDYRIPVARWCGASPIAARFDLAEECFVFDSNGFIYASTTDTQLVNPFVLYEPLAQASEPIGMTLPHADKMPATFDFARQLDTLGSPVSHVVLREDEVDDILESGTRITYVLGHERDAFTALVSARDNMNLANGSIEYVDLRFDGKVYLKKKQSKGQ